VFTIFYKSIDDKNLSQIIFNNFIKPLPIPKHYVILQVSLKIFKQPSQILNQYEKLLFVQLFYTFFINSLTLKAFYLLIKFKIYMIEPYHKIIFSLVN